MSDIRRIIKYSLISFSAILCIFAVVQLVLFYQSNYKYSMSIHARFKELGPIYSSMPVYYKGFKIGKTRKIEPTEDYQYTLVKIILYPEKLALPKNIEAKVKKFDNGKNYIELEYPDITTPDKLQNEDIIEGNTQADMDSFMSAQIESGMFSSMGDNMNKTLNSVEKTSNELNKLFADLRTILRENRQNIKTSTENTALILDSLGDISYHLDKALSQEKLNNMTSNLNMTSNEIKETSSNLKNMTKNLDDATKNLDKIMSSLDGTMTEAHKSATNITGITNGLCETMGKRFAGMRIMFGKPSSKSKCSTCSSK